MYLLMIVALMFLLPLASILVEVHLVRRPFRAEIARRWFVFCKRSANPVAV